MEGIGEDGKRSTITLGAIERLAGENLGVNLQESKHIGTVLPFRPAIAHRLKEIELP
jgi:hypothetical protein